MVPKYYTEGGRKGAVHGQKEKERRDRRLSFFVCSWTRHLFSPAIIVMCTILVPHWSGSTHLFLFTALGSVTSFITLISVLLCNFVRIVHAYCGHRILPLCVVFLYHLRMLRITVSALATPYCLYNTPPPHPSQCAFCFVCIRWCVLFRYSRRSNCSLSYVPVIALTF